MSGSALAVQPEDVLEVTTTPDATEAAMGLYWRLRLRHEVGRSNIDEFDYERKLPVGYLEYVF